MGVPEFSEHRQILEECKTQREGAATMMASATLMSARAATMRAVALATRDSGAAAQRVGEGVSAVEVEHYDDECLLLDARAYREASTPIILRARQLCEESRELMETIVSNGAVRHARRPG